MAQSGGQYEYAHQQMQQNGENTINLDNENKNVVSGGEVHHHDHTEHHSLAELLQQRSGNFGSTEDEPHGDGCEKKGFVEKIKEKVPGMGNKEQQSHDSHPATDPSTTGTATGYDTHHEKKGIMDKIKDKLPGTHTHTKSV